MLGLDCVGGNWFGVYGTEREWLCPGLKKFLQIDYSTASNRALRQFDRPSVNRNFLNGHSGASPMRFLPLKKHKKGYGSFCAYYNYPC